MKEMDRQSYVSRYTELLHQHSYSPASLGWGSEGRQDVRFSVLSEEIVDAPKSSVLDVGCGFADLYAYLLDRGWVGTYRGIDLVPSLIDVAKERHPGLDLRVLDIADGLPPIEPEFDFVVASGVFNAKLAAESNSEHIERSLARMLGFARVAVCVDFLSTNVDFQNPIAWHSDPAWAIGAARRLSRRFRLRHDYMPFEFALFIYADDDVSPRRVFASCEKRLTTERRSCGDSARIQPAVLPDE